MDPIVCIPHETAFVEAARRRDVSAAPTCTPSTIGWPPIGKKKAAVAVAHSILVIAWHLLANDCDYTDLGSEHFTRNADPEARTRYLVRQLEALGHKVTVEPAAA